MAEVHELDADIIYVLEGSATFVTGGTVENGKTTAPNEIRGSAITDGEVRSHHQGRRAHRAQRNAALVQGRLRSAQLLRRQGPLIGAEVMIMTRRLRSCSPSARRRLSDDVRAGQVTADVPAIRPDAIVNLASDEGAALVRGQWRYSDARSSGRASRARSRPAPRSAEPYVRHRAARRRRRRSTTRGGRRSSRGSRVAAHDMGDSRSAGTASRSRFRRRSARFDTAGSTVVFEIVVDDYAEVWVDGTASDRARPDGRSVHQGLQRAESRRDRARRGPGPADPARRLRRERTALESARQLRVGAIGHARLLQERVASGRRPRRRPT